MRGETENPAVLKAIDSALPCSINLGNTMIIKDLGTDIIIGLKTELANLMDSAIQT